MTEPLDDHDPGAGDEGRPIGTELCPRCGARRVGAFRSCLSCGFDYEAPKDRLFVPPPDGQSAPPPPPAPSLAQAPSPGSAAEPPTSPPATAPPIRSVVVPPAPAVPAAEPLAPPLAAAPSAPSPAAAGEYLPAAGEPTVVAAPPAAATPASQPVPEPAKWASPGDEGPRPTPSVTRPTPTMRSTTPAIGSRRTRLAAGVAALLVLAAVAVVAIGFGRPSPVTQAGTSPPPSHTSTFTTIRLQAIDAACVEEIGPFVKSLESLASGVGTDVTFRDYSRLFAAAQAARGGVDISKLDPPCIAVFAAAQAALGEHAEAYNSWNDCNTTTGCTRQSIETSLQDHWAKAMATLAAVQSSMP